MKVVAVELCFENLESVKFRMEDVVHMYLSDIKRQISSFSHMHVMEMEIAEDFRLHLNARGNVPQFAEYYDEDRFPFERVAQYHDITSVDLWFEDGTKRELYVDWDDGERNSCDNRNQTTVISEANGDLFVVVCAEEKAEDVFESDIGDEDPFYRKVIDIKEG